MIDNSDWRKATDWHAYNAAKRKRVIEMVKPLCELFSIEEYDYVIKEKSEDGYITDEYLVLDGQHIGCCGNSEKSSFYEAVGYVIINRYCRWRSLGAFEKQTKNYIKRYWIDDRR